MSMEFSDRLSAISSAALSLDTSAHLDEISSFLLQSQMYRWQ